MFSSYLIEISLLRLLLEATAAEFQRCILRDFFLGLPCESRSHQMQAASEPSGGTPWARQKPARSAAARLQPVAPSQSPGHAAVCPLTRLQMQTLHFISGVHPVFHRILITYYHKEIH